jgi:hypothetical protein
MGDGAVPVQRQCVQVEVLGIRDILVQIQIRSL